MKILYTSALLIASLFTMASCECDHEPEMPFKVGWVVCTDGEVMPFCEFIKSHKVGTALVYYVNPDMESPIAGYAVYLNDTEAVKFANTLNEEQGTSADLLALDGNENTYAIYSAREVGSELADMVFDMWTYGQSAYVPSVAQLRQVYDVKDYLNPRMEQIGGDILPDDPDECWYWSSTEVSGQKDAKSWLFSMQSDAIQETPKDQRHKVRAVITLYR